jgi:hypothetical protein
VAAGTVQPLDRSLRPGEAMRLQELLNGLHVPVEGDRVQTEKPCACPVFVPNLRTPDNGWVCAGCGWGHA